MKTTKKHFDIFRTECEYWIKKLKLDNWKVYYTHQQLTKDSYASCATKVQGHVATLYFTHVWYTLNEDFPLTEKNIKESAKHEVIHLLLARMSDYAVSRDYTANDCLEAEEELVRKLEKIIK